MDDLYSTDEHEGGLVERHPAWHVMPSWLRRIIRGPSQLTNSGGVTPSVSMAGGVVKGARRGGQSEVMNDGEGWVEGGERVRETLHKADGGEAHEEQQTRDAADRSRPARLKVSGCCCGWSGILSAGRIMGKENSGYSLEPGEQW